MEYVRLVWAKKWLVLAVLLATVVFATAWAMTRPKMYRATTKLTLQPAPQLSRDLAPAGEQETGIRLGRPQDLDCPAEATSVVKHRDHRDIERHRRTVTGEVDGRKVLHLRQVVRQRERQRARVLAIEPPGREPASPSDLLVVLIPEQTARTPIDELQHAVAIEYENAIVEMLEHQAEDGRFYWDWSSEDVPVFTTTVTSGDATLSPTWPA